MNAKEILLVAAALVAGAAAEDAPEEGVTAAAKKVVSEQRNLPVPDDVRCICVDPEVFDRCLRDRLAEDPPEDSRRAQKVLQGLGALPQALGAADLGGCVALDGYYDPVARVIRLRGTKGRSEDLHRLLTHEFVHAAQDHAGFLERLGCLSSDSDEALAARGLVEGDAVVFTDASCNGGAPVPERGEHWQGAARTSSCFARADIIVRYYLGPSFVAQHLARNGGSWDSVNRLYERPPASTAELLHPELYYERAEPRADSVEQNGPALAGAELAYVTVVGELRIRLLLEEWRAPGPAAAAAGWSGDRLWGFMKEERPVVVWRSVWKSSEDADEFVGAYTAAARRRARRFEKRGDAYVTTDGTYTSIDRRGVEVLVVTGADQDVLAAARRWWDRAHPR